MKKYALLILLFAASLTTPASSAETNALCVHSDEAVKWPPELDAVRAAPKNHHVILENDDLRVLEVTVAPGEKENLHHHRWPSVMVVDTRPRYVNYDKNGNEIKTAVPAATSSDMPIVIKLPAGPTHAIHNLDTKPFHAIRIEFKKLC